MMKKTVPLIFLGILALAITACEDLDSSSQILEAVPFTEISVVDDDTSIGIGTEVPQESLSTSDPFGTVNNADLTYVIVDTGQNHCYSNSSGILCPSEGEDFYGQDAQYQGVQASYVDNNDGTIADLNTGLMWQQTPDLDNKSTYEVAVAGADGFDLAGYTDWRLPTIKELYSLIIFNGSVVQGIPYIDTDYFDFRFGDESLGERELDGQYWSSTEYVGTTMRDQATVFGVNFADGRIKGYPPSHFSGGQMLQFVRYVRGNSDYGANDFIDNRDGTINDQTTGLMWQGSDSAETFNWEEALDYCVNLDYAGYQDWRLPNAKELHSIVDYSRSPQTSNSAAIAPIFDVTETESWYWTNTTHLDTGVRDAVYIAFGQAYGLPGGNLIDVHGAGAQRSDPKSGDPAEFSAGRGSTGQEDQVRIYNYARCVRARVSAEIVTGGEVDEFTGGIGTRTDGGQGEAGLALPPQGAIDACVDLASDSACSINTPNGTLTGSCTIVPSGELACVPDG